MEESEKRKERLRAMRDEADQTENSNNVQSPPVPSYLSNPLIQTAAAMPQPEEPCAPSRFDFYTNPMSAFSANKKGNNPCYAPRSLTPPTHAHSSTSRFPSPNQGFINTEVSSSLSHQFQSNYSPDQIMYQPRGYGHNSSFQRNPIGISRPFTMHQGNPGAWNQSGGAINYNVSSSLSSNPCFNPGQGRGRGRGQWYNHSPNPVSGYGGSPRPNSQRGGGGRWYGGQTSYGSGHIGGRGLGSRGRGSAMNSSLGPENFYNDSMVEDPWKSLPPVLWSGIESTSDISKSADSLKFSSSSSFSVKRTKISEASNKSSSQPSLAEYLAASFNDATQDESNT